MHSPLFQRTPSTFVRSERGVLIIRNRIQTVLDDGAVDGEFVEWWLPVVRGCDDQAFEDAVYYSAVPG